VDLTTEMETRYGTRRPVRRIVLVVVTVLVAGASLGWLAWAGWIQANPKLQAEVAAFDVKGPHLVDTTIQMRVRDRYVSGTCLLRASAVDHSIVGELNVSVKDVSGARERVVPMRTEREATTVEVIRCTAN
jgi:hypothetical protein